ncbi:hypothetical protein Pcinc_004235 [Petrolisthes cinctipes]|uniref:Uncharacterized protein n=1 Tax=Petrolisthes cinctipes TaxID=88211 RepID=A0AAE1GF60_PETCI|nr:hypothetical protein Pcinc_004235 [Petrolisthes cinctipes]
MEPPADVRLLKTDAVPDINLPKRTHNNEESITSISKRQKRIAERNSRKLGTELVLTSSDSTSIQPVPENMPSKVWNTLDFLLKDVVTTEDNVSSASIGLDFPSPAMPSANQDLSSTPAMPSASQDLPSTSATPSASQDLPSTPAMPSASQDLPSTSAMPSASQDLPSTSAMPSASQDLPSTPAMPSASQDLPSTSAMPSASISEIEKLKLENVKFKFMIEQLQADKENLICALNNAKRSVKTKHKKAVEDGNTHVVHLKAGPESGWFLNKS